MKRQQKIGLALGGGAARGWAHIGVLRALEELNIPVAAIAGTSMGALVGAFAAAEQLEELELTALGLAARDVARNFLDVTLPRAGLIEGRKIVRLIEERLTVRSFAHLRLPFRAVATNLLNGAEVVLQAGDLVGAIRASLAIPGVFTPVTRAGILLADGGLVNPVPVSVVRAMQVDAVIAVDVNYFAGPATHGNLMSPQMQQRLRDSAAIRWAPLRRWLAEAEQPNIFDVMGHSIRIIEAQITEMRLRTEPADILIRPDVGAVGIMAFHRAAPAIEAGYRATLGQRDALRALVAMT
jgi:NTE family protein